MKVLYVTQIVPYPPHGGVLQRGFNLLRELGAHCEVHLLAFHHPDELPPGPAVEESRAALGAFCKRLEYFDLWPKRSRLHKLVAFALGFVYPRPFSVLAHKSGALARRLQAICTGPDRPDVVHLDTIALAPYARFCAGVPTVLAHHNIESQLIARRAEVEKNPLARIYLNAQHRRLERYEAAQCARFPLNIVVSQADGQTLERLSPGAVTAIIPNGVDTNYFAPRRGGETPAVIYTGGMNMFANRDAVDWFLEFVWPRLTAAIPGVKFFAIGQRPTARLLEMAARDPDIEAPGFVPDVRTWVARAAVYVVPLRVGGGTRLKVLDAMAQGKAIVATTLGAEGIDARGDEHFVLADDAEHFAAQTLRLLADPALREKLGDAARRRVEEVYAWPRLGADLAATYARVVRFPVPPAR